MALVLQYHGKMWYNVVVPHLAIPNFGYTPPPLGNRSRGRSRVQERGFKKYVLYEDWVPRNLGGG